MTNATPGRASALEPHAGATLQNPSGGACRKSLPAAPPVKKRRAQREGAEQAAVIKFARGEGTLVHPELALLVHIPNGGQRQYLTAAILKGQGVQAGFPDLFLPVARSGFHGLCIEMKWGKNDLSDNQKAWKLALEHQGYKHVTCWDRHQAINALMDYLFGVKK